MTTFSEHEVRCAVCAAASTQLAISSTNSFGSPDLDLRPAEMQRSTMHHWLQECPTCGYVADSIAIAPSEAGRSAAASDAYRALIDARSPRALYSRFRRATLSADAEGLTDRTARMALCAAWAADDAGLEDEARACRRLAARGYAAVIAEGAADGEALDAEAIATLRVIRIDALRRAGDFEEAAQEADRLVAEDPDAIIQDVARFQAGRARQRDAGRHTVADATGRG